MKICVITDPFTNIASSANARDSHLLLFNLLEILEPLGDETIVITANLPQSAFLCGKVHIQNIKCDATEHSAPIAAAKYAITQFRVSRCLSKITSQIDVIIFFIAAPFLLPMLTAKLRHKKTIVIATGSGARSAEQYYKESLLGTWGFIFSGILGILEHLTYSLASRIVVYTPACADYLKLGKWQDKVSPRGARFVDVKVMKPKVVISQRKNIVGYVGRFSREKGIMNFIRAIPLILNQRHEVRFFIAGDGPLLGEVNQVLASCHCDEKVTLSACMPHEEVSNYLNRMKLLVLPSHTEGLPNIVLEAMACGSPVLATKVGSIPDIIRDGETGFILKDNSPEAIAKAVTAALCDPRLDEIVTKARQLVEREYSYEAALERYKVILGTVM